ncbi:DNA alkylation repair protein [Maritalea mediterranea]|uniref:DNA alkylation repair protein n=1 Tax=Maritalea mediterranea TaxID=2909667 RepID=A0ABS9EDQ5_9HYPH|nr:DNA alkylation repair protein [Maritalea mediterranea]MCF4099528.1 DNA alkylation repair protein [Maritalea mediterranea]
MAANLSAQSPAFPADQFVQIASIDHQKNELKQRSQQIQKALIATLPPDLDQVGPIILGALGPEAPIDGGTTSNDRPGLNGFVIMPFCDFVAEIGIDDWPKSAALFKEMTKRFSAEFAVRPFIAQDPDETMRTFAQWAKDENAHVRRLASEGCRPLLPWGMRLHQFVKDPSPILPILEQLKDDPTEYVRRSVANNLNDIAKNLPELVAQIAAKWMQGASKNRQRLVRHACRTLIKNGHPPTLKALGFAPIELQHASVIIETPKVKLGGALTFTYRLLPKDNKAHPYILDFAIHLKKANGSLSPKVFKLGTGLIAGGKALEGEKKVPIRPITTRRYYPGEHKLELFLNGQSLGVTAFQLEIDQA